MELSELIRERYSVRAYQSAEVEPEKLQAVLDAFALAPTAANRQSLGLVVVPTAGKESDLRRIYNADWFAVQPPLVLCACVVVERCWVRKDGKCYGDVDVAIAMDHAILAATDAGLGTCWIGAFDVQAAREVLSLPEGVEPVVLTPLGYSADTPRPKLRKKVNQLVHHGRW
jgi:nitroreductase